MQRRLHAAHKFFRLIAFAPSVLFVAGCTPIVDHFSGRQEACEILAIGQPASAKIVRLIDTGTTINNDPVVNFVLEVRTGEGAAYLP